MSDPQESDGFVRDQSDEHSEEPLRGEMISPGMNSNGTDENPQPTRIPISYPQTKPIVTWVIFGCTVLVYLLQIGSEQFMGTDLPLALGAKFGPLINAGQWWRLITPVLLHGSIMHILFNMYALIILGKDIESSYGHWDFLLLYLITGFGGNVFSYIFSPQTISVGASSSLFGLIAAQGFLIYKNKKFIRQYQRVIQNVISVVVLNLVIGLSAGIDNWGHLGGLVSGAIIAFFAGPLWELRYDSSQGKAILSDKIKPVKRLLVFIITFLLFALLAFMFSQKG